MSSEITPRTTEIPGVAPTPENQSELLGIIWRRKFVVVLITLVGVGLGYLYYLQQTPIYSSSAQILIIKDQVQLPIEGLEVSATYDRTHETLIPSPLVIDSAVKDQPEIAQLATLRGWSNPAGAIIGGLKVTGDGGKTGDILKLEYESANREDCPVVLAAVVKAYQNFLGNTYKKEGEEAADLIGKAKDDLEQQIKSVKEEYAQFQKDSPLLTLGETTQNVHQARLQKIEEARSEAVLSNSQLQAQVDSVDAALKRGSSREAINLMVGNLSQTAESPATGLSPQQTIEERLFPLLVQEQELLEKYNYGPDHPQVRNIRKNIEMTREMLLGRSSNEGEPADFSQIYLTSLREKIRMNDETIRKMSELFDQEQRASRDLANFQIDDETYRAEIGRKERLFDAVLKRLEEINLVRDSGGARVELTHPPTAAGQVRPDMFRVLLAFGVFGVLGGCGLAYLIDTADRRFKNPDEIRNEFGLPVFGHIPVILDAAESKSKGRRQAEKIEPGHLSPVLASYHRPKGRVAEAYRGVRTALFFSTRISGHKVFQITSPSPGDGKTTLACNLAISAAHAGKKVLLIDADFRRPRVHTLFGAKTELGMSSVIAGTSELGDVIRETAVEHLSILPCGPRPNNPAELLTSRRFEELLEMLRDKYEYVFIDSPPILAVTDPLNVAARVDGVILVMRLTKTARHSGRRALESLEGIGSNIIGVVVNGVGSTRGYGYGYGYGYNYGRYSYGAYRYGGANGNYYEYAYSADDTGYYTDDDRKGESAKHNGNGRS